MTWLECHELTKHSIESLRRSRPYLDWANMPNPCRHYEGVPVLDLPADPPAPQISALEVLDGQTGNSPARDGAEFLSQLMFYSASISASKRVPSTGDIYALCVNPSSGNLHPTEFHFCTRGLAGWPDGRATGIGAFFDDQVNQYLGLSSRQGQVVYHFAIGYPVPDPRLEARN